MTAGAVARAVPRIVGAGAPEVTRPRRAAAGDLRPERAIEVDQRGGVVRRPDVIRGEPHQLQDAGVGWKRKERDPGQGAIDGVNKKSFGVAAAERGNASGDPEVVARGTPHRDQL